MVIAGRAWENATISSRPELLLGFGVKIAQNDSALRAGEGFVCAAGQPGRSLVQRVLELATSNQAKHVRAIIEQRNIFRLAKGRNLLDRLRKEKKALAHYHQLRRGTVNQLDSRCRIYVIVVGRQRQVVQIDKLIAPNFERLAAILDTAAKDPHRAMADVAASIR